MLLSIVFQAALNQVEVQQTPWRTTLDAQLLKEKFVIYKKRETVKSVVRKVSEHMLTNLAFLVRDVSLFLCNFENQRKDI